MLDHVGYQTMKHGEYAAINCMMETDFQPDFKQG